MTTPRRLVPLAVLIVFVFAAQACSPYQLKGKVVRGDYTAVIVTDADDPRFAQEGVPGATLHLQADPGRVNRKTLATGVSEPDGSFALPVSEPGAGLLIFDVGLFARRRGFAPAEGYFQLPPGGSRVLVVMAPGDDRETGERRENLRDLADQYR